MILFIDTEWADVLASELVSLALVSDCGRFEFYAERDPLPSKPTGFVRSVVYPLLDRGPRALRDDKFTETLHAFFEGVHEAAWHGKVLVAFDHPNDLRLLNYALDGFQSNDPRPRPPYNAFNLGLLGTEFNQAVEDRFASDAARRARRHNAFTDAWVNRDVYLQLQSREALALSELKRLQGEDVEMATLLAEVLGAPLRAAGWWMRTCGALGQSPRQAYADGRRVEVLTELHAIRNEFPV
jgi:hypothetical protein